METHCPYLKDVDQDLQDRQTWDKKDTAIMKRRLGERPARRNIPYPNSPNPVVMIIDENTAAKTDQEITMIMNAPDVAVFIPVGDASAEITAKAQKGFNTYIRHICNYRPKKEYAVDAKNARGFSVAKQMNEEHPDWGKIPSFEIPDNKDVIVPAGTTDIQKSERVAFVLRPSLREFKNKADDAGWNRRAVKAVTDKLVTMSSDDESAVVQGSDHDDGNTFSVVAKLVGLNTSDMKNDEIVVWEIGHYATQWDVDKSNGIVKKGDKCISWVCPDVPDELLHIVPRFDETFETVEIEDPVLLGLRQMEGQPPYDVKEVRKDRAWPYIQHRYEIGDRLWYSSRGIGHLLMDDQIAATAIMRMLLIYIDYAMQPVFEDDGASQNQGNVKIKPGIKLPSGVKAAKIVDPAVIQQLLFLLDNVKRSAAARIGAGGGVYSSSVNDSRKLEKTAAEVHSENAKGDMVSSASVDRFNDSDKELFRQLWAEMQRQKTRLPIIDNNQFAGFMDEEIYAHDFIIVPAASEKTLNPDMQFMKDRNLFELNAEHAEMTGADLAAALKQITTKVDPNLASTLYPEGTEGELPITSTLMELKQSIEQIVSQMEQTDAKADQALQLGSEVAGAL